MDLPGLEHPRGDVPRESKDIIGASREEVEREVDRFVPFMDLAIVVVTSPVLEEHKKIYLDAVATVRDNPERVIVVFNKYDFFDDIPDAQAVADFEEIRSWGVTNPIIPTCVKSYDSKYTPATRELFRGASGVTELHNQVNRILDCEESKIIQEHEEDEHRRKVDIELHKKLRIANALGVIVGGVVVGPAAAAAGVVWMWYKGYFSATPPQAPKRTRHDGAHRRA